MIGRLTGTLRNRVAGAMLGKQFIFVGCLLGILLCGACFGPVYKAPPPPPLHIDLHGIRTIQVEVTNATDSKHLDATRLATTMGEVLNAFRSDAGVRAARPRDPKPADATLSITILREVALPAPQPPGSDSKGWSLQVYVSATLTAQDGRVVWSEKDRRQILTENERSPDSASSWEDASITWVENQVCIHLARQMFYGVSDDN